MSALIICLAVALLFFAGAKSTPENLFGAMLGFGLLMAYSPGGTYGIAVIALLAITVFFLGRAARRLGAQRNNLAP